jgi:hypothetical protein
MVAATADSPFWKFSRVIVTFIAFLPGPQGYELFFPSPSEYLLGEI